eukprot:Pgem_evm1s8870
MNNLSSSFDLDNGSPFQSNNNSYNFNRRNSNYGEDSNLYNQPDDNINDELVSMSEYRQVENLNEQLQSKIRELEDQVVHLSYKTNNLTAESGKIEKCYNDLLSERQLNLKE